MVLQPIHDIAEICSQLGVKEAIMSPGSRCAPLTLSFARHPEIMARTITDERSAGFIAFGMAQSLKRPVVTVCTSGTAVLNYGPAVAEAFYQQTPLVVITADRPPEWIDQQDGQTIRQQNPFNEHIKKSFQLPDHYDHPDVIWHIRRIVSEAVNEAIEYPSGPVHINVPLREPFYPEEGEKLDYSKDIKVIENVETGYFLDSQAWDSLEAQWAGFEKILIVAGQRSTRPHDQEYEDIESLANDLPVVGDIISNLHGIENVIKHPDSLLIGKSETDLKQLQPDLLITFGKSVISKNLKVFLRNFSAKKHWHIQPAGQVADTFQSVSKIIRTKESAFLRRAAEWTKSATNTSFRQNWIDLEEKAVSLSKNYIKETEFGEFQALSLIINKIPEKGSIHLANSMPVRLANFIGLQSFNKNVRVVANRGTSGIDGSNGTAVGDAISSNEPVVLITGDLAFFYDRNAFWHNYDIPNLKIVLLNNHAGGIFGMIDGPSRLPELGEFFETNQPLTARNTADDYGFEYHHCKARNELEKILQEFFSDSNRPALLEIETLNELNKSIFKEFKKILKSEL